MKRIDTELGTYVIFQATEDRGHPDGDIKAGDWLYQPADYDGDVFSPSYATAEEAEAAAMEHVYREISDQDADH